MPTLNTMVEEAFITCEVCIREVPCNEAVNPEMADYVVHFCGLECYATWKSQNEQPAEPGNKAHTLG